MGAPFVSSLTSLVDLCMRIIYIYIGALTVHIFQRGWVDFERAARDTCLMCTDRHHHECALRI